MMQCNRQPCSLQTRSRMSPQGEQQQQQRSTAVFFLSPVSPLEKMHCPTCDSNFSVEGSKAHQMQKQMQMHFSLSHSKIQNLTCIESKSFPSHALEKAKDATITSNASKPPCSFPLRLFQGCMANMGNVARKGYAGARSGMVCAGYSVQSRWSHRKHNPGKISGRSSLCGCYAVVVTASLA